MNLTTVATMVIVLGIVWGGFAMALVTAMRKESQKVQNSESEERPQ